MNRHTRKKRKKFAQDRGIIEAQKAVDGTDRAIASQMPLDGSRAMTDNLLLKDGTKPGDNAAAAPTGWVDGALDGKSNTGHGHGFDDLPNNVEHTGHGHGWSDINNKPNFLQQSDLNGYLTKEEANRLYQRK